MNRPNVEALAARAIEIEEPDYFSCATIALATYVQALEAERDALRADAERFREILGAVVHEIPGYRRDDGNAPGHAHAIPGIWDSDNGAKAGKPCAWCKTWNLARAAIAAKEPK